MEPITKRAFVRNSCQARIEYAEYNSDNYCGASMLNNGDGGMYFETENALEPGTNITIRLAETEPDTFQTPPEAKNGYRAEVMWCRKLYKKNEASCYGVGVRFIINVCDQCGNKVSYSNISITPELFFLCVECLRHYQEMEQGKLKECFDSYLLGNVL